jgi:hypothetical protein
MAARAASRAVISTRRHDGESSNRRSGSRTATSSRRRPGSHSGSLRVKGADRDAPPIRAGRRRRRGDWPSVAS